MGIVIVVAMSSAPVATVAADDAMILCMVGATVRNWAEGAIFVCSADESEMLDVSRSIWSMIERTILVRAWTVYM